jgi:hypothetical protein
VGSSLTGFLGLLSSLTLCCGGDLATTSTARSKRDHACASASISEILSLESLAMSDTVGLRPEEINAWAQEVTKQAEPYLIALGRFVSLFSQIEANLQSALWRFAKVPTPTAQAIFSGIRTDGAMQYIRRIADAEQWSKEKKAELEQVFAKLGAINKLRNDLLHYGATMQEPNVWTITNKMFAHTPEKIQEIKITPAILEDATADLIKVLFHLIIMGWGDEMEPQMRDVFNPVLRRAWQYKSPLRDRGSRKNRKSHRKQPRQPKA